MIDLPFLLASSQPPEGPPFIVTMIPILAMLGLWYLFLIKPQRRKDQDHKEMLKRLKKDDRVVTIGGIHGQIAKLDGDIVHLKIADRVTVRVNQSAISLSQTAAPTDDSKPSSS